MKQSPKSQILSMLLGSVIARAIYVAAELGIADQLKQKPLDIQTLAKNIGAHELSLYRLMRMLSGHDFFSEDENSLFSLTPLGECLTSDSPESLRALIRQEDETRWRAIGKLRSSVLSGIPSFDQIYGKSYFEYLAADPKMNYRFEAAMSNLALDEDERIAAAIDVQGVKTLVDVGGGRGGFVAKVLQKHPHLRGILFELPHVVFPKDDLLLKGIEDRCDIVSGSFFESVPEGGDAYILKRVLHDWDDHSSGIILKHCRQSMQKGGKIVVVESIVPTGNDYHFIKDVDVYMMALFPGRERTEEEFRSLFESAGLELVNIKSTHSELSIIEGVAV